jgi:hypothetical protein
MSQAVQDTTPQTFTCFPKLPLELQREVWKYAIPKLQAIKIRVHNDNIDGNTTLPLRFSTDTHPSGLLSACKVSREEILRVYKVCIETKGHARKIRFDGEMATVVLHDYPADFRNPLSTYTGDKLQSGFHSSYSCFQGVKAIAFVWCRWGGAPLLPFPTSSTLLPIFPTLRTFVHIKSGRPGNKLCLMSSEPVCLQTYEDFVGPQLQDFVLEPASDFQLYAASEQGLLKLEYNEDTHTRTQALDHKFRLLVPADESIKDDIHRALQRRRNTCAFELTVNLWFKLVLGFTPLEAKIKYDFDRSDEHNLDLGTQKLWQRYLEDVSRVEEAKKYGLYYDWW